MYNVLEHYKTFYLIAILKKIDIYTFKIKQNLCLPQ